MLKRKSAISISWIVRVIYHMFLFTILCQLAAGRPFSSEPTKVSVDSRSVEELRKRVKSRVARHAPTHLAWKEVYLYSGTGYNLAVNGNGEVYGARDFNVECSILRHSEDAGLVVLQAMSSGRFIAISDRGELITTPAKTYRNLLEEHIVYDSRTEAFYIMYKSHIYEKKNWFVGLDNSGRPIRHRYRSRVHHSHREGELFTLGAHPTPIVTTAERDGLT